MSLAKLTFISLLIQVLGSSSRIPHHTKGSRVHKGTTLQNKASRIRSLQSLGDDNYDEYNSNFRKKGKGNGKGSKKGKSKRTTAAPSISHQPSTSTMPSSQPSISSMPSLRPSSKPSSSPTSKPSSSPSSRPTSSPTSTPTLAPSSSPSSIPSASPSHQPTVSSRPSASPSISSMPSYNHVEVNEVIYDENNNEIGIKSACKAPKQIDSLRYAERTIQQIEVEFQYLIRIIKKTSNGGGIINGAGNSNNITNDDILHSMDYKLHSFVYDNYIQCQGYETRRKKRRTQLLDNGEFYNSDVPIGVSSLPIDTINNAYKCNNNNDDETCLVVDGGISLFYEEDANFNPSNEEYQSLLFIKNAMDNNEITLSSLDDNYEYIVETTFVKGRNIVDRGESLVGSIFLDDDELRSQKQITVSGGMFIGITFVILFGLLAAVIKRKRSIYSGLNRNDPIMSDILDDEYEPKNEEYKNRVMFPVELPSPTPNNHNGKRYLQQMMVNGEQNVHYCSSSLCLECNQKNSKIKFVRSSDWIDDGIEMEIDGLSDSRISDKTLDFSRPTMNGRPYYGDQNTVEL